MGVVKVRKCQVVRTLKERRNNKKSRRNSTNVIRDEK